jgi:iron complex outermembrane receptor protein
MTDRQLARVAFLRNSLSCTVAALVLVTTSLAISLPARADNAVLEEVVVEAQKKIETVTDTPIAINAITGDQFQRQASFTLQDVARTTPGLSFETGVTPDIHLRGVSTVTRAAAPLRTNIYQDGALIDQPRNVLDAQFDIERFEILRGPQGTLYGKSSPTGTINIQTKSPNMSEVDGYVSSSLASRETFNTQFGVSLPVISEVLAVRVAGVFDENRASGLENTYLDMEPKSRSKGARFVVMFQPIDTFSARLAYNYREKKENPWYAQEGNGFDVEDLELTTNRSDRNDARDELATLELVNDFSDTLSLISVTSYQDQKFRNFQDSDGGSVGIDEQQLTHIHLEPLVQEDLRLMSTDNDFWDWQLGLFYQSSSSRVTVASQIGTLALVAVEPIFMREDNAVYTHNTFKFTDETNLIVGLRYQDTRANSHQPTTITSGSAVLVDRDAIAPVAQNQNFYAATGTIKLQHFFTPELMAYGSYDRAYRAGAANIDVRSNLPQDFARIEPESANSIELGIKGGFWDQRGRFAIAIYDQVYKDFQQDIVNLPVWAPAANAVQNLTSVVATAKEAETRGIEAETSLLLADTWDVSFSASFNDSKFNDFENIPCTGDTAQLSPANLYNTCDVSGDRLPQSSRWSGVLGSNYFLPLGNGMDWYFNALVNAKTSQVDEVTQGHLGGYATADFFTGLRAGKEDSWDVSLWVKNAFDRVVVTRVYRAEGSPLSVGTLPYNQVFTNPPRQFGVTGTYRFD